MPVEVLEDETDKKRRYARILAQRQGRDRTALENPNPDRRYKWINNRTRGLARAREQGLEIVDPKNTGGVAAHYGETREGAIQLGEDLILAEEPMDLYKLKREDDIRRMNTSIENTNLEARDNINRIARNEGRSEPHRDNTFDESHQGEDIAVVRKKKG